MVLKTEICRFSGARIYPGHGMLYIRTDSQNFRFLNAKCNRLFHLRLKPANLAWTQMYRKQVRRPEHHALRPLDCLCRPRWSVLWLSRSPDVVDAVCSWCSIRRGRRSSHPRRSARR